MSGGILTNSIGTPNLDSRDDAIRRQVAAAMAAGEARANAQAPSVFEGMLDAHRANPKGTQVLGAIMEGLNAGGEAMGVAGRGGMTPEAYGTLVPHAVATLGGAGAPSTARAAETAALEGDALLGVFGGKNAVGADKKGLAKLGRLEKKGATGAETWQETGWARGADGKGRFEIPDTDARIVGTLEPDSGVNVPLREILDHPKLFEAYPDIGRIGVNRDTSYNPGAGSFYPGGEGGIGTIGLGPTKHGKEDRSTLLHEIQHAIAQREGFDPGSNNLLAALRYQVDNPGRASDVYADRGVVGFQKYQQNAGEVEARNVQRRMDMTPEQLRATAPRMTEDVPRTLQWYEGGPAVPATDETLGPAIMAALDKLYMRTR